MAKPPFIEVGSRKSPVRIPILHEDRASLAIDKPAGWLLTPTHWQHTRRNLQAAVESSIAAGDFWARSRGLEFLRFVHRLDAETSGVLLLAKSAGAVKAYSALFESRDVEKVYLAVVRGVPRDARWTSRLKLAPELGHSGRMKVDERSGKTAETRFCVLQTADLPGIGTCSLVEAKPLTGRTHQIRVHLSAVGHPILGDELYRSPAKTVNPTRRTAFPLALRAVALGYADPFTGKRLLVAAPTDAFLLAFGFAGALAGPTRAGTL